MFSQHDALLDVWFGPLMNGRTMKAKGGHGDEEVIEDVQFKVDQWQWQWQWQQPWSTNLVAMLTFLSVVVC